MDELSIINRDEATNFKTNSTTHAKKRPLTEFNFSEIPTNGPLVNLSAERCTQGLMTPPVVAK